LNRHFLTFAHFGVGILVLLAALVPAAAAVNQSAMSAISLSALSEQPSGRSDVAAAPGAGHTLRVAQACPRGYNFNGRRCVPGWDDSGPGYRYRTACPPGYDSYNGRCYANRPNGRGQGYIHSRGGRCPRGFDFDWSSNSCVRNY
jgi:hypothetical protein